MLIQQEKTKKTFKCDTFADFELETAISQAGMKQIT